MKKFVLRSIAILAICLTGIVAADAQVIVVRPGRPVMKVRPVSPGPRHIWVDGEYAWRGGQYIYVDGYWATPPPKYKIWKQGHWKKRRGGWIWIPGHWR